MTDALVKAWRRRAARARYATSANGKATRADYRAARRAKATRPIGEPFESWFTDPDPAPGDPTEANIRDDTDDDTRTGIGAAINLTVPPTA